MIHKKYCPNHIFSKPYALNSLNKDKELTTLSSLLVSSPDLN